MILSVGNKVIYPCQGPCLIVAVVRRIVDDSPMTFYQLLVLNNGGGKLFVPVDNVQVIGIRPLLKKSEISKLLDRLKQPTRSADNYKQRASDNLKLLASGSAFDLAEVVESLTELSETKSLSFGEHKTLERAKRLLVCEISEVMGETNEEAEERIDEAAKARKVGGQNEVNTVYRGATLDTPMVATLQGEWSCFILFRSYPCARGGGVKMKAAQAIYGHID